VPAEAAMTDTGPGTLTGARKQRARTQSHLEPVVAVQQEVCVGAGIVQHVGRQRAHAPVCQLVALVRLHYVGGRGAGVCGVDGVFERG
jgi:hypothetical protein